MSIAVYDLRLKASYDAGVAFDLQRFRDLLKAERKTRVGARETLADRAGLNKSTVQNAEVGPVDLHRAMLPAMLEPIVFSAAHPLVIRPHAPHGFTLETAEGIVIYHSTADFSDVTFRLLPGPAPATVTLTVNMSWIEA